MRRSWIFILVCLFSLTGFAQESIDFSLEDEITLEYHGINQLATGFSKGVEAYIIGQHNVLQIDQSAISSQMNYILSFQDGNNNYINALQSRDDNAMSLFQIGNNNDFLLNQTGDGNLIDLMVSGSNNKFDVTQFGNDNFYRRSFNDNNVQESIEQLGNRNVLDVRNLSLPLTIRQTGGMKIIIR